MNNMKDRQKLSDNQLSASIQAAVPEMSQNIRPINMTDNHSLFFSPATAAKISGLFCMKCRSISPANILLSSSTEKQKMGKRRSNGTSANTSWITALQ